MAKIYRLNCKARLIALADIRGFVAESASALGLGADAVEDLKVCVDEAATNIVKYGYRNEEGDLAVEVWRVDGEVLVRIRDDAPAFDFDHIPPPDLELPLHERPVGGMGVHLMRNLADGVSHQNLPDGGNELLLRKRITGAR